MSVGGAVDLVLHEPHGLGRPAKLRDLIDIIPGRGLDLIGEGFHVVTPAQGVCRARDPRLVRHDLLGAKGDLRRLFRREGQRLVEAVGVERLGPAQDPCQGLDRHPNHVVHRLLGREGRARRLCVEPEPARLVGGVVALPHQPSPQAAGRPELGDFFQQVVVGREEEREPGSEVLQNNARRERPLHVLEAVGQGEGDLLRGRRAGLPDVVA